MVTFHNEAVGILSACTLSLIFCDLAVFYAPASIDRGYMVFGMSVSLSTKTLTLAMSFDWKEVVPSYST